MTIKALYPSIEPSLNLDFANTKRLDPRITFTRASTATYVGSNGLIQNAAVNEARFDHNPATGESLGLLVEEARTNVTTFSERVEGRSYVYGQTALDNALLSPNGTQTAIKIRSTIGTGLAFIGYNTSISASSTYTFSIFAKAGEWTRIGIRGYYDGTSYRLPHLTIDLATKQVIANSGATAPIILDCGNGWIRISITFTTAATPSPLGGEIDVECHNTALAQTNEVGDGTSGIYVWGAQLELGGFPTSYIPTPATFTSRASTATFYNSSGVIQTAASGVARSNAFLPDNNGVFRAAGLLLEAAGTNLITYSQAFNSTNYNTGYDGGAFTENATTAPDGTVTASKLTRNTGATGCWWGKYNIQAINVTSGTVYTVSCYLKAAELSTVTLVGDIRDGGGLLHNAAFTLTGNGSYVLNGGTSAQITPVGNGWYRCSVTGTASTTDTEEPALVVLGSGTSGQGFFAWGFQLEASSFATSYIPTVASTVTRSADTSTSATVTRSLEVVSLVGSNFTSWFNSNEGSLVSFSKSLPGEINGVSLVGGLSNGVYAQGAGGYGVLTTGFFSGVWQIAGSIWNNGRQLSGAPAITFGPYLEQRRNGYMTWNASGFTFAINGVKSAGVVSSGAYNTMPFMDRLIIYGYSIDSYYYPGHSTRVSRLAFYPTRLSDTVLQAITAY